MKKVYKYLLGVLVILALNIPVSSYSILTYIGAFIGGMALYFLIEINYIKPNK